MVKFNVFVSVHPSALVPTKVYVPLSVYVCPFTDQVYVLQAETVWLEDVGVLTVKTNVLVSAHPAAFVLVEV